jgi:serine/threonine-protein kinase
MEAALKALGKYELRGTLGRGAMGVVYDGWDPRIARRVAIKTVPLPVNPDPQTEEEIARFKREAQAAGRLTHPNIVGVYDYGETSDLAFIVMEFVDGPSLKALLDKQERFALPRIRQLMEELLAGLQFSHERGVVHRDIKPANVMLTADGHVKIADFGIARIEMSSMTQAGTMLGTPAYMSPEQFRGEVADARTDVYAAGVLLYQLLTGERPFEGSLNAIMHKVLTSEPPPPSELAVTAPPALDAVVRQAMAKRPADRFATAAAFAEAIRAALAGETLAGAAGGAAASLPEAERTMVSETPAARTLSRPPAATAPPAPSRARMPVAIGAGVAALLVLAGGGWLLLRPHAPGQGGGLPPPVTLADTGQPAPRVKPAAEPPPASTAAAPTNPSAPRDKPGEEPPSPPAQANATPATPPASPAPDPHPPPAATVPANAPAPEPPPPAGAVPAPSGTAAATPPAPEPPPQATPAEPPPAAPPAPAGGQPQKVALALPLREQVAQALQATRCALAESVLQDSGRIDVFGVAGSGAARTLRQQLSELGGPAHPVDWQVHAVDPVFCDVLALLRPLTPQGGAPAAGLTLALAGGRTALRDGERILPRLTMPGFAGEVRVDYLAHDGSVVHFYPSVAEPQRHVAAQPARRLAPGERLALGDPGPGRVPWEVGPPYGTDMVVAIASSVPLPLRPPAQNAEDNAAVYLHDLAAAITEARQAGARLAGTVLLVDTLPK